MGSPAAVAPESRRIQPVRARSPAERAERAERAEWAERAEEAPIPPSKRSLSQPLGLGMHLWAGKAVRTCTWLESRVCRGVGCKWVGHSLRERRPPRDLDPESVISHRHPK